MFQSDQRVDDARCRAITVQKAYIANKMERGLLRRTLEASNDVQDVVRALRSIASLVDVFTVRILIASGDYITQAGCRWTLSCTLK